MKPIKAYCVVTEDKKVGTFQLVFFPGVFAYCFMERKADAVALAKRLRQKGLADFPEVVPVMIRPIRGAKASAVPLADIRELLED
jgi:hypothetical protein